MSKDFSIYPSFKNIQFSNSNHFLSQKSPSKTSYPAIPDHKTNSNIQSYSKISQNNPVSYLAKFQPRGQRSQKAKNVKGLTYR